MTVQGLVTRKSAHDPAGTANRLVAAVTRRGMEVFARIDHAAGAQREGLAMPPAEVIIFGNARVGTPLMKTAPTLAIDLPLKMLVWGDEAGATWLSYNDPVWLAGRHGLDGAAHPVIRAMAEALAAIADEVTAAATP